MSLDSSKSNHPGDLLSSVLSPEASSKKVLPKSSTTSLLDGDNKRMNFTDEMEETEENSYELR